MSAPSADISGAFRVVAVANRPVTKLVQVALRSTASIFRVTANFAIC